MQRDLALALHSSSSASCEKRFDLVKACLRRFRICVLAPLSLRGARGSGAQNCFPMPQLADACAAGDVAAVRRLLAVGNRSKNEKSSAGAPTTVLAAGGGHAEVVAVLLEAGSKINLPNQSGWTPAFAASIYGHEAALSTLLQAGASANAVNDDGWSPLFAACFGGSSSRTARRRPRRPPSRCRSWSS